MKRIFIAVKFIPGQEFLKMFSAFRSLPGEDRISWVSMESIHLTLVFLGDTEEQRINIAGKVLETSCRHFGEFDIKVSGTGVFRNMKDPRVIWTGIENPEKLEILCRNIAGGLTDAGFTLENRPFNAHITLGRVKIIKNISSVTSLIEKYRNTHFQDVHVSEVSLFESILKPAGPVYKPVGIYSLNK